MNRHIFDSNTKIMCQEMKWLYVLDVQPELIKVTQQRTTSQERRLNACKLVFFFQNHSVNHLIL